MPAHAEETEAHLIEDARHRHPELFDVEPYRRDLIREATVFGRRLDDLAGRALQFLSVVGVGGAHAEDIRAHVSAAIADIQRAAESVQPKLAANVEIGPTDAATFQRAIRICVQVEAVESNLSHLHPAALRAAQVEAALKDLEGAAGEAVRLRQKLLEIDEHRRRYTADRDALQAQLRDAPSSRSEITRFEAALQRSEEALEDLATKEKDRAARQAACLERALELARRLAAGETPPEPHTELITAFESILGRGREVSHTAVDRERERQQHRRRGLWRAAGWTGALSTAAGLATALALHLGEHELPPVDEAVERAKREVVATEYFRAFLPRQNLDDFSAARTGADLSAAVERATKVLEASSAARNYLENALADAERIKVIAVRDGSVHFAAAPDLVSRVRSVFGEPTVVGLSLKRDALPAHVRSRVPELKPLVPGLPLEISLDQRLVCSEELIFDLVARRRFGGRTLRLESRVGEAKTDAAIRRAAGC